MEPKKHIGRKVRDVKNSLDDLQSFVSEDECSKDSLFRLSRALKDINEEVDMLRNVMQIRSNK
jgi:hypothetical protein